MDRDIGYWKWLWKNFRSIFRLSNFSWIWSPAFELTAGIVVVVPVSSILAVLVDLWCLGVTIPLAFLLISNGIYRLR